LVVGQNPGTNHPRMLTTLQAAARRGATLVSINPLAEAALVRFRHPQNPTELVGKGTPMASMHLPVRVGGDVALLQGVSKHGFSQWDRIVSDPELPFFTLLTKARIKGLDLVLRLVIRLRIIILQIANIRISRGSDNDLCQMNLRFGEIEGFFVCLVEVADLTIADRDLRCDLFVYDLLNTEIATDLGLQVRDGHFASIELLLKLLLRVSGLELGKLGIDVGIRRHQAQLDSALQHDFVVDEASQNFHLLDGHLIVGRSSLRIHELQLELLVDIGVGDGLAIDGGRNVRWRRRFASGKNKRAHQGGGQVRGSSHGSAIL